MGFGLPLPFCHKSVTFLLGLAQHFFFDISVYTPMRFAVITVLLLTLLYFSRFIPSKEQHAARKRFNKLPVGTLTLQAEGSSNNTYVDAAGTVWIRRPYIMSLRTNRAKNMYLKPTTCLLQLRRKRLPTNPFSTRVSKYLQKDHSITTVHSKIQSLTFSLTCCPRLFILKLFFCVYEIYNKYVVCLLLRRIY